MIRFIDNDSPDDTEICTRKEMTHLPRVGEEVQWEDGTHSMVKGVVHDLSNDDVYLYMEMV